jgi:hypothetical protein
MIILNANENFFNDPLIGGDEEEIESWQGSRGRRTGERRAREPLNGWEIDSWLGAICCDPRSH